MPVLGLGAVRIGVKIYVLIDTPKCVRNFYYYDLKLYRARLTSNHLVLHQQSPSNVTRCISHRGVAVVCSIGLLNSYETKNLPGHWDFLLWYDTLSLSPHPQHNTQ